MNEELRNDVSQRTYLDGTHVSKQQEPKRIIHFASGETLEEESSDDEDQSVPHVKLFKVPVDTLSFQALLSWKAYAGFLWMQVVKKSLFTCDFLGGKLANLLGLNTAKYQYAVDEYLRNKNEHSEDKDVEEIPMKQMTDKQDLSLRNTEYGAINMTGMALQSSPCSTVPNSHHGTAGTHNTGYIEDER
nr:PREDICTED: protein FAM177B isoform X1 [Lepisosteus oculatus]